MRGVYGLSGISAVCLALIISILSFSVEAAGGKAKDVGAWKPPTHIQMVPIMVRAGNQTVPMTFFLEATKRLRSEDICKRMPRVRDAVIRTFSKKPIPVRNRRLVLKGVEDRLLSPVNRAVGKRYIRKVFAAKGAVRMGAGKIKRRPYAEIDSCKNVLRSEKEREQAAKANK